MKLGKCSMERMGEVDGLAIEILGLVENVEDLPFPLADNVDIAMQGLCLALAVTMTNHNLDFEAVSELLKRAIGTQDHNLGESDKKYVALVNQVNPKLIDVLKYDEMIRFGKLLYASNYQKE